MAVTKDDMFEALRQVEDPELGMDIVDLGLLYDVEIDGAKVKVIHSLTSMGCPAGPMIQEDIHRVASEVPGVENVERAKGIIGSPGLLELKIVEQGPASTKEALMTNGSEPT